jgi:hypothetical protein
MQFGGSDRGEAIVIVEGRRFESLPGLCRIIRPAVPPWASPGEGDGVRQVYRQYSPRGALKKLFTVARECPLRMAPPCLWRDSKLVDERAILPSALWLQQVC